MATRLGLRIARYGQGTVTVVEGEMTVLSRQAGVSVGICPTPRLSPTTRCMRPVDAIGNDRQTLVGDDDEPGVT